MAPHFTRLPDLIAVDGQEFALRHMLNGMSASAVYVLAVAHADRIDADDAAKSFLRGANQELDDFLTAP